MISRVAEHCYWLSRYLERAESTARVLEVNQTLLLDLDVPVEQQWRPLLIISGIHDFPADADGETVQRYMTWDEDNACSIISSLRFARENARIIREVISAEMWERINYYHLWMHGPDARNLYDRNRNEFYSQIRRVNQLVHGIADATMSKGEAWEFLQFGTYLERACQTARILDVKYHIALQTPHLAGTPIDNAHWTAILMSCSAYEPYHKQKAGIIDLVASHAVAEFLIYDPIFPRSIRRCLRECQNAVHAISGRPITTPRNETEIRLHQLIEWLEERDIHDLIEDDLHESLTTIVNRIHEVGDAVYRTYFEFQPKDPEKG